MSPTNVPHRNQGRTRRRSAPPQAAETAITDSDPASKSSPAPQSQGIEILQTIPGRIRIRLPALKGNNELVASIQSGLALVPGIQSAQASAITGSLLIAYDPVRYPLPADLLALARNIPGLLDEVDLKDLTSRAEERPQTPGGELPTIPAFFESLNARVGEATGGADLTLLVPLFLLVLGFRGLLVSERPLPTWYDYLWFAFGSYMMLNRGPSPPETHA